MMTKLYKAHNKYIISFLRQRGFCSQDAEDAVQTMWLECCERNFPNVENARGFLICKAYNIANRLVDKNTRVACIDSSTVAELSNVESLRVWYNEEVCHRVHERIVEALEWSMQRLTSFGVPIFNLIEDRLAGFTQREIADKYATTPRTIRAEFASWYAFIRTKKSM